MRDASTALRQAQDRTQDERREAPYYVLRTSQDRSRDKSTAPAPRSFMRSEGRQDGRKRDSNFVYFLNSIYVC